eukprot:gene1776-545_t
MSDEERMDDVAIDTTSNIPEQQEEYPNEEPPMYDGPAAKKETGSILPMIFSNVDRSKRYKIMLDVVPSYVIIIYLIVVLIFLMAVAGVGLFLVPTAEKYQSRVVPYNDNVFLNQEPVVFEFENVNPFNLEAVISFYFNFNATNQGDIDVEKDDFELGVILEGANLRSGAPTADVKQGTPGGDWTTLTAPNTVFKRYLECRSVRYTYYFTVPGTNGDVLKLFSGCGKIDLFHLAALRYSNYRVTLTMRNAQDLYNRGLIKGDMIADLQLTNEHYTYFEIALRTLFGLSSIIFLFYFLFFVIRLQQWKKWHTTQKWLPVFLFLQIFYHDPIFSLQAVVGGEAWSIYHATGALAFIYSFLLFLIIFIHGLFVPPKERYFWKFYFFKILLVVVSYLTTLALFLWSAFQNVGNPTVVQLSDGVNGYGYLEIVVLCLVLTYIAYVTYYVVRAISHFTSFRRKYSIRFMVIGAFSFFACFSMLGVTVIQNRTRYTTEGATFLISHAIIYVYFGSLAHFFTPSGIIQPDTVHVSSEKNEKQESDEKEQENGENPFDDEHFQKEVQPEEETQTPAPDTFVAQPEAVLEMELPRGQETELAEVDFGSEKQIETIPTNQNQETSLDSAFENQNFGFDEDPNSFPNFENNTAIGDVKNEETNNSMKIAEVNDAFSQEFE